METAELTQLCERLRASNGLAAKRQLQSVAEAFVHTPAPPLPNGDDAAAIPAGNGYQLLAMEGFIAEFVATDPWFAGWCAVMVNASDIAAMGGRPVALVNALWAAGAEGAAELMAGLAEAARVYQIPIVGGHANLQSPGPQLAAAMLGHARTLLPASAARPGQQLLLALDLRGALRPPFRNWCAALDAPPGRLRADLELLPELAEAGLVQAAKDVSQAGIVGTAAMLAESARVGFELDLTAVPRPTAVPLEDWLQVFPSYGFLLSCEPRHSKAVLARFAARDLTAAVVGEICEAPAQYLRAGPRRVLFADGASPVTGFQQRGRWPVARTTWGKWAKDVSPLQI